MRVASRAWLLLTLLTLLLWSVACDRSEGPSQPDVAASASAARPSQSSTPQSSALAKSAPSARTASSAASPARAHRGLFWKAQSKSATAYLLGSIHVGKKELYPLNDTIESAFRGSDTLVLEVYLDDVAKLDAAAKLAQAGMYPAGDSLDRHIGPKLMQAVRRRMPASASVLLPPERLRPWFVATLLIVDELGKLGFDPEHGIDMHFQQRAAGHKRIVGIETVDEQVAMFTGLSDAVQELMLKEALEELDEVSETMNGALLAWQKGDAEALDALLLRSTKKPEYRPVYKRMIVDRNLKMAEAVEGYLRTKSTYFVVLGSGHLVGKQGVVELLRARQHRVLRP